MRVNQSLTSASHQPACCSCRPPAPQQQPHRDDSDEAWDVDAEIARELRELGDGGRDDPPEGLSTAGPLSTTKTATAPAASSSHVDALWAALAAREHLADSLSAKIQELQALPHDTSRSNNNRHNNNSSSSCAGQQPGTASAEQVCAAVAALQRVTGTSLLRDEHQPEAAAASAHAVCQHTQDIQQAAACVCSSGAAITQHCGAGAGASATQSATLPNKQQQQEQAGSLLELKHPPLSPAAAPTVVVKEDEKPLTAAPASAPLLPPVKQDKYDAPQLPDDPPPAAAASGAGTDQHQPPVRQQLSPPHTPNTQDKRQHAAAAQLAQSNQHQSVLQQLGHQQQQQVQSCSAAQLAASSSGAALDDAPPPPPAAVSTVVCSQRHGVVEMAAAADPADAAADAAAAAVAREQAALHAAAHQRSQEQERLQQLLQQQAAAAAARQAAQAAARQQLQQQAQTAAVSYMAAWRISRAWLAYRSGPVHAAKLSAAVILQAAVRGAAARRALQHMRARQQLLTVLESAVRSGQHEAVQQAAAAAADAGCQREAQETLKQFLSAAQAAARALQQAAGSGNCATFGTALAAAARFSSNAEICAACSSLFSGRQHTAAQALEAAVSALPLRQVQHAVDTGHELGLPGKELAAALEAARARDRGALARLSELVKDLTARADRVLVVAVAQTATPSAAATVTNSSSSSSGSFKAETEGGGGAAVAASPCDPAGVKAFALGAFQDAVAACRQYGRAAEAAAAESALQQCRQAASDQLTDAAAHSPSAQMVEQLLCWCRQLGGLQSVCDGAASTLAHRQQELVTQLQQTLSAADTSPAASAVQALLQRCQALGVQPAQVAAARQQLQHNRSAAEQRCWAAVKSESLQVVLAAVAAAAEQGVDAQSLESCMQLMLGRQQEAVRTLGALVRGLCQHMRHAACSSPDTELLLQEVQHCVQRLVECPETGACTASQQQLIRSCGGVSARQQLCSHNNNSSSWGDNRSGRGGSRGSSLMQRCQELQQQAAVCCSLGLQDNVAAAVAALTHAVCCKQSEGASVLAVCSQSLDGTAADATSSSGDGDTHSPSTPQPTSCLWEEGVGVGDTQWSAPAATSVLWTHQQQQRQLHIQEPLPVMARPRRLQQCAAVPAPVLLQQQWDANLQVALAEQQQRPPPQQQQQQQVQHSDEGLSGSAASAPPNWLRQLLSANAAVPLAQLARLDLSLEQLPGLTGLGVLCPQLTWLAVNMDGLSSLRGLQGCRELVTLSAQDNQLQSLPDISCHPKLTSLLLDSNKLSSIVSAHSSSSSGSSGSDSVSGGTGSCGSVMERFPKLPHNSLQVLSLSNNQLSSICKHGTTNGAPDSKPANTSSTRSESSHHSSSTGGGGGSSSSKPALHSAPGLCSLFPGLHVLRLSGNQLSSLSGLQGCSALRTLDVSRNSLTCLQGLAGCHLLQHLDASDNKLTCFPARLHLPLLHTLKLASNAFSAWPHLPPLPHLLLLSLADNQLQRLPPERQPLHGMLQLRTLDLGFNSLRDLSACIAVLQAAPQLQEVELHDNAFHTQVQQQQGGGAAPWHGLEGGAADAGGGGGGLAAAAVFEGWYRQQVAAGLPWLQKLDGDTVEAAERLAGCTVSDSVALRQQQQGVSSLLAAGRLLAADSGVLSLLLRQQLRSACLQGGLRVVGWQPNMSDVSGAVTAAGTAPAAAAVSGGLQAAGILLPHLARMVEASQSMQQCEGWGVRYCSSENSNTSVFSSAPKPGRGRSVGGQQQAPCTSTGWLQRTEALWCVSSRAWLVQLQAWQQQQAATQHSNSGWLLLPAESPTDCTLDGAHDSTHPLSASRAPETAMLQLLRQQLLQLQQQQQQSCGQQQQQQQLVQHPGFNAAAHKALAAASVVLQCAWRAHSARCLFAQQQQQQQQLQQQAVASAAVVLQSGWRGVQARRAAAAARQQLQQQQVQLAAAAAVKIQAAVRGHKVRQRLKAALAAARGQHAPPLLPSTSSTTSPSAAADAAAAPDAAFSRVANSSTTSASGPTQVDVGGSSTAAAAAVAEDDGDDEWDYQGAPDNFLDLQSDLLDGPLLMPAVRPLSVGHSDSTTPAAGAAAAAPPVAPDMQQVLLAAAGRVPHAITTTAAAAAAGGGGDGGAASAAVCTSAHTPLEAQEKAGTGVNATTANHLDSSSNNNSSCSAAGVSSQFDAKIAALMAEWGFTDRATAEAYYKRQRHTLKAVTKHKREEQLKDPAARLKRLQSRLGCSSSTAGSATAAGTPAVATAKHAVAASGSGGGGGGGGHTRRGSISFSGGGLQRISECLGSSSPSGVIPLAGSGTPRLLLKQVSCPAAQKNASRLLARSSCSQKQQHQVLSLPSLVLPSISPGTSGASTTISAESGAGGAGVRTTTAAGGGLPKLQRQ